MQLHSSNGIGHDFYVPEDFKAPILPEWRLASFSIIMPIPRAAGLAEYGEPFDFATAEGWRYGRDKGVRTVENPQWDPKLGVFRKPEPRYGYYGDPIIEGGRPF